VTIAKGLAAVWADRTAATAPASAYGSDGSDGPAGRRTGTGPSGDHDASERTQRDFRAATPPARHPGAAATPERDTGAVGTPERDPAAVLLGALDALTRDPDALVQGAAYGALGTTGCPAPLAARAVAALDAPAWQVRSGAATALSAAEPDLAVPALAKALADPNADVRKAAVLALTRHRGTEDARAALATATADPDADVRAYAAKAL
jgi:hypothetical protein